MVLKKTYVSFLTLTVLLFSTFTFAADSKTSPAKDDSENLSDVVSKLKIEYLALKGKEKKLQDAYIAMKQKNVLQEKKINELQSNIASMKKATSINIKENEVDVNDSEMRFLKEQLVKYKNEIEVLNKKLASGIGSLGRVKDMKI